MLGFLPSLASFLFGERMSRPTGKLRGCLLPRLLLSSEIILICVVVIYLFKVKFCFDFMGQSRWRSCQLEKGTLSSRLRSLSCRGEQSFSPGDVARQEQQQQKTKTNNSQRNIQVSPTTNSFRSEHETRCRKLPWIPNGRKTSAVMFRTSSSLCPGDELQAGEQPSVGPCWSSESGWLRNR